MACSKLLRSEFLTGADPGGLWSLDGFNATSESGPFGGGGNWPWTNTTDDNPLVDFDNIEQGFYSLEYYKTGACAASETVVVPVRGGSGGNPGPTNLNLCNEGAAVNLWNEIVSLNGSFYDPGELEVTGAWSGTVTGLPGFSAGGHFTQATFDPSGVAAGSYSAILTMGPVSIPGFTGVSCVNCDPVVSELTIVISEPLSAGEDTIYQTCEFNASFTLLSKMGGSPDSSGNWSFVSGDASAFTFSNDGNGANDSFDPFDATPGFHVAEYTVLSVGGCPGETKTLTIEVRENFNTGGGTFTPIQVCDYDARGDRCDLLTVYSAWCADQNRAAPDPGGRWLYWGHRYGSCTGAYTGGDIGVNGGACQNFNTFQEIGGGDNPEVFLECEANTACVGLIYAAPTGDPCGGSNLVIFQPGNCGTCTCTASISESNCTATVTPTSCVNPTYQWQEWNGTNWANIAGATGTQYTGSDGDIVRCEVDDDNCNPFTTPSVTLSCAPNCTGSVTISQNGCSFSSNINNIASPAYQWQTRPVGGGTWSNIGGATLSTYSASVNGEYRVRVTDGNNACQYFSNIRTVNVSVTVTLSGCIATANISGSVGTPSYQWQKSAIGANTWSNISGATSSQYTSNLDEDLRCIVTFNGGCQFTSNVVTANCGPNQCTLQIDAMYVDGCDIVCEYSGHSGSQTIQWSKADNNPVPGDCNQSGGWNTSNVGTVNNATPGVSRLTPTAGTRCYRIIIDDIAGQGPGCIRFDKEWYNQCCSDSIDVIAETCDYSIDMFEPGIPANNTLCEVVFTDQIYNDHRVEAQATRDCGSPENYGPAEERSFMKHYSSCPINLGAPTAIEPGEYIEYIKIHINDGGAVSEVNLNLSAIVHTNQGAATFASQLRQEFVAQMGNQGLTENTHYQILQFTSTNFNGNYTFNCYLAAKNRTGAQKWAGIDKNDHQIKVNGNSPRTYTNFSSQGGFTSIGAQTVSRTTDCGEVIRVTADDMFPYIVDQLNHGASNYDTISFAEVSQVFDKTFNPQTGQCKKLSVVPAGACTPQSYAWSTGDTTPTIYVQVGAGLISCTVTCANGCQYTDSITV